MVCFLLNEFYFYNKSTGFKNSDGLETHRYNNIVD